MTKSFELMYQPVSSPGGLEKKSPKQLNYGPIMADFKFKMFVFLA